MDQTSSSFAGRSSRKPQPHAVETAGLELHYGTTPVLRGVDLEVAKGETLALLGPSGCGKTTLLRLLAGLLTPSRGTVSLQGKIVADGSGAVFEPPERRGLGMVFQDYALWPHMSVGQNVGFPLEMRGVGRAERDRRVARALERVGLAGFGERDPAALSGGQQQRVAIARAIIAEPELVLFDEPLSNLDRELRENMVDEIAGLVASLGLSAVYVTHDQSEAFTLADRIAVMRSGLVVQLAEPGELVAVPASAEVAEFLRLGALLPAERREGVWAVPGTGITVAAKASVLPDAAAARILLPPDAVSFAEPAPSAIAGIVTASRFRGDGYATRVRLGEAPAGAEIQVLGATRHRVGERVDLAIRADRLRWFSA